MISGLPSGHRRASFQECVLFRFLSLEDYINPDPTELLESPKIGLHLPEVLTVEEINAMISAIDPNKAEAQRDRAMMETLYGCGLRVSELVNVEISKIYGDEGYLVVRGKGNKADGSYVGSVGL